MDGIAVNRMRLAMRLVVGALDEPNCQAVSAILVDGHFGGGLVGRSNR